MKNIYTIKWLIQRITALLLIPLSFWFIYQCISFQNFEYKELQFFFQSYLNIFIFLSMMIAMLVHAKLGCETIIQDYISQVNLKKIFNLFINFITICSLFLIIVAIIRLNITL
jgi:succinate dehydrogenase / fumarate reductase membrane anchor subunit